MMSLFSTSPFLIADDVHDGSHRRVDMEFGEGAHEDVLLEAMVCDLGKQIFRHGMQSIWVVNMFIPSPQASLQLSSTSLARFAPASPLARLQAPT